MSQLVRLEGKHSTQNAHCALVIFVFCTTGENIFYHAGENIFYHTDACTNGENSKLKFNFEIYFCV